MIKSVNNPLGKVFLALFVLVFVSCAKEVSQMTGWGYNDPKNGGYEVGM